MANLTLRGVRKNFGEVHVIHGVDLDVRDGEFVVFVGPSGCGKSTLLRMICGLERATSGDILHRRATGERAARRAARPGDGVPVLRAVSAHDGATRTWPSGWRTFARRAKRSRRASPKRRGCCGWTTLLSASRRSCRAVSASASRSAARSCASRKIFLFDEPLSNLDAELRVSMRAELAQLHRRLDATMIYVTHDQVEAMTMADKIVVLRAGRVEQVGPPLELYNRPGEPVRRRLHRLAADEFPAGARH